MADGMQATPRILDEAAAREYLGGRDPRKVMAPVRLGGRNCWDKVALDQKLNEIFGVAPPAAPSNESPLDRWRRLKRDGSHAA